MRVEQFIVRLTFIVIAAVASIAVHAAPLEYAITTTYAVNGNTLLAAINDNGTVVGSDYALVNGAYYQFPLYGNAGQLVPAVDVTMLVLHSSASAINNAGQLAGTYNLRPSVFTPNDPRVDLGALDGRATAINNAGHVAGSVFVGSELHAFLYRDGAVHDIGTLDHTGIASSSEAAGMNDNDQVVGRAGVVVGREPCCTAETHAFLYSQGTMIDLGVLPGGSQSEATAIDNFGRVVGDSWVNGNRAFIYENNAMHRIPMPGGLDTNSLANDINDQGYVVGGYVTAGGDRPFIYGLDGDTSYDLNDLIKGPHPMLGAAAAINEHGQILVRSLDGQSYVVLSPVPEPASWHMLLAGIAGLFVVVARRARLLSIESTAVRG